MTEAALVRVLKAIGHPKRFRIVQEIAAAGELSCGQVCDQFDCSQPTISHHMKILAQADVLIVREAGQQRIITVNKPLIDEISRFLPGQLTTASRGRRAASPRPAPRPRPATEKTHARRAQRTRP
jgi:ArsR family transcriptional regulator